MARKTSRPSRPPHRRFPGHIDIKQDLNFCDEIAKLCFAGEISYYDAIRLISRTVVSARPQKIAQWVRRNLEMPAGKTNRHGRIVLTRMQSAIADLFQDPDVKRITYIKGPRIGASFLIAALMLYFACHENRPVMFYDRALKNAQSFYEEKFWAIVDASEKIRHLLPDEKSSTNRQRWTDRTLTTGAGIRFRSVSDKIKSDMAAKVFADEAGDDAYRNGTEGSKVGLLKARAQEFSDSTVFLGGTPTTLGECTVSEEWEKSNKCEWYMRFSCCGHEGEFVTNVKEVSADLRDEPQGPGIRFVTNAKGFCDGDVWYECAGCQRQIPETEKVTLLNTGWWQPTAEGEPGHVGVRSWSAHSQDPEATWTHIANAYLTAREQPSTSQDFVNLWLGQVFRPPTLKTIKIDDLRRKEVVLVEGKLPKWIRALVCGGDGQRGTDDGSKPGRLEFVVLGVGEDMRFHPVERFVVDHRETIDTKTGEITRSPIKPFTGQARQPVMDILDRTWETEDGRTLRIMNTAIDVGYEMNQATEFVMSISTPTRPVVPVRGEDKPGRIAPIGKSRDDRSFVFRNGVMVQKLGVSSIKDYLADTLSFPTPGPQSWTFPLDTSLEFYSSLLAEHLIEKPSGRTEWVRKDKAETGEVWDCLVYAYAAFLMMLHWTGEWGTQVLMPQVRIRPQTVEASILSEAARVKAEADEAEKAPAKPTLPAPPVVPNVENLAPAPAAAAPAKRNSDDMFEIIEDDGPTFEIVRHRPAKPAPEPEPETNPFIIAGRRY